MALAYYFPIQTMTQDRYDEVIRGLENAGQGAPDGRSYHCAFKAGEVLHVFDVWESQEKFDAFGQTLIPLLTAAGVDPGTPEVAEVYNIIIG
jgi:hypothetical protein